MEYEIALAMPKVELHVHLEGSIQPETLLRLAERNKVFIPATTVEALRDWYRFQDFPHFVEVYTTVSSCIRTPEDLELITREFLIGQAAQNILYTEATFTAFTLLSQSGMPWSEQFDAINRAQEWADKNLNVGMQLVVDIVRERSVEEGETIASWAIEAHGKGVCALGLTGIESLNPPRKHAHAFATARKAGLPITTHAGETEGPWSIRECIDLLHANRIGHGVRCLEDSLLVEELVQKRIPLEVCPTSNICLNVFRSLDEHALPQLIERGIIVSINSDDPPMFNTTLTAEYVRCAETFGLTAANLRAFVQQAARDAFLPDSAKVELLKRL